VRTVVDGTYQVLHAKNLTHDMVTIPSEGTFCVDVPFAFDVAVATAASALAPIIVNIYPDPPTAGACAGSDLIVETLRPNGEHATASFWINFS
jgi:hypothetical protein